MEKWQTPVKNTSETPLRRQHETTAHTINCSPGPLIFSRSDPFGAAIWYPEQPASKPRSLAIKAIHSSINHACLLKEKAQIFMT